MNNELLMHKSPFDDSPHEECGVFGVASSQEDVARMTFFGLFTLQHRGQESAGIVTADGPMTRPLSPASNASHSARVAPHSGSSCSPVAMATARQPKKH